MKRIKALPTLLFSDEGLMPRVGFKAHQVRAGVCQRGAAKRQQERTPGPMCPDTLANNIVQWNVRDVEVVFNGAIRAMAQAGVLGKRVTGMADGTALETTERYRGCGQATRQRRSEDTRGRVHAIEVTVYGWNVLLWIAAVTKMPLAVNVGQIQAHEALWARALVTPARMHLAGDARLAKVIFDQGFGDGTTRWWLDQQGIRLVVPAQTTMAVTAEARALAAAGEGVTAGRRVHTVRQGQGRTAWSERLEAEVVGISGLTTYEPYGTEAHGGHANRHDFAPNPINAVVVRQWQGKDDGPGGTTVCLTNAAVEEPLQPFDDDDARRLLENCWIKEAKPPWDLKHPPQQTARAVRVHVLFTLLLFALATAYRRQCEQAALGAEPVGWQRWRRQLLEQHRDQVIVFAHGDDGILHVAEYALL